MATPKMIRAAGVEIRRRPGIIILAGLDISGPRLKASVARVTSDVDLRMLWSFAFANRLDRSVGLHLKPIFFDVQTAALRGVFLHALAERRVLLTDQMRIDEAARPSFTIK